MNRPQSARRTGTTLFLLLATLPLVALLVACAGGIRGEAPFAQVTGWRLDGEELSVDLRLRNVNDEPLRIFFVEAEVDIDDGLRLFRHREALDLEIAAGGFETIRIDPAPSEAGRARLGDLSEGAVASLAYTLDGKIETRDNGTLDIARQGHIYPVPGRPGEFR